MPTPDNPTNNIISAADAGPPADIAPAIARTNTSPSQTDVTLLVAHAADPAQRPVGRATATMQTPANLLKTIHEVADRAEAFEARAKRARADIESRESYTTDRPMMRTAAGMRDQVPGLLRTIHAVADAARRYEARAGRPDSGCGCAKVEVQAPDLGLMPEEARVESGTRRIADVSQTIQDEWLMFEAVPHHGFLNPIAQLDLIQATATPVQQTFQVITNMELLTVGVTVPVFDIPITRPDLLFQVGTAPTIPDKCDIARQIDQTLGSIAHNRSILDSDATPDVKQLARASIAKLEQTLKNLRAQLTQLSADEPEEFVRFVCAVEDWKLELLNRRQGQPANPDAAKARAEALRLEVEGLLSDECRSTAVMKLEEIEKLMPFVTNLQLLCGAQLPLRLTAAGIGVRVEFDLDTLASDLDCTRDAIFLCNLMKLARAPIATATDFVKAIQRALVATGLLAGGEAAADGLWQRGGMAWNEDGTPASNTMTAWEAYMALSMNEKNARIGHARSETTDIAKPFPSGYTPTPFGETREGNGGTPGETPEDGTEPPAIPGEWEPGREYNCDANLESRRAMMVQYLREAIDDWQAGRHVGPPDLKCTDWRKLPIKPHQMLNLMLAISCQETGMVYSCGFDNSSAIGNNYGILQVTFRGCRSIPTNVAYNNTPESIRMNMRDAIACLCDKLGGLSTAGRSWAEIAAELALRYNGGAGWLQTYRRGEGEPEYVDRIAEKLSGDCLDWFRPYLKEDERLSDEELKELIDALHAQQTKVNDALGR